MKNMVAVFARWLTTALALMLVVMVLLICLGVILRYVWGVSLLWLDESLVFSMVVLVFLGAISVSQEDRHLRMSLIADTLPPSALKAVKVLEHLLTAGTCLFVAWYSFLGISRLLARGTRSNMGEVPLWLVQSSVLVGLLGIAFVAVLRLFGVRTERN